MNDVDSTVRKSPMGGLLVAQFFGAFNDNAFKMVVILIGIGAVLEQDDAVAQSMATWAMVVFTLPLMLGSLPAMGVGDRVSKRTLLVCTKLAELTLMLGGTLALWWQPEGVWPLVILGGMGLQSAFFAPAKYGILPETLPHEQLTSANGKLEAASFLAIILGTVAGGAMLTWSDGKPWIAGAFLACLSVVVLLAALRVLPVPASGAKEPFQKTVGQAWRTVRGDRTLWLATLGSMLFWGLVSLLGQDVLIYSKKGLELGDDLAGLPYALFAIGVGAGSLLAGRLSRGKVETGLIPMGAIALTVGTLLLGLYAPALTGTLLIMAFLGVASGFVVVPLNALLQWRAPADRRGSVIAMFNGLSFVGILFGNLGCLWLAQLGASTTDIFVIAAILTGVSTLWAVWLLPVALLRVLALLMTNTLYRVRTVGAERIPETGGAMLLPNHVSFLDGLFLQVSTERPIRFIVDQAWYERPFLRPLLRGIGAIPVTASGGPRSVLRALRDAGQALDDGEVVCMFGEGEVSRTGSTLPFRRGLQRILKGRDAVVLPIYLDRVYGSMLSSMGGKVQWWPTRVPCPVTVEVGEPLPSSVEPAVVRQRVEELGGEAWKLREYKDPLHRRMVQKARRAPWRRSLIDSSGRQLSRLSALSAAVILARRLRAKVGDAEHVGMLLPPSSGGAIVAMALSLSGRVVVPLNYTVGAASLASAAQQAELRTVVTSRAFRERIDVPLPEGVEELHLEDLMEGITKVERLAAAMRAMFWPQGMLERACGARRRVHGDDTAAILFSSGSTGDPKGVVLSHGNLLSNCEALAQLLPLHAQDRLLGVLPLFHSFGNMALWYALQQGAATVFHPNPLDGAAIGELIHRHRVTMLLSTPTFLQMYMRRCEPSQLGSVRLVLTGAEKLTDKLADAFAEKFGIRPLQGYGTTECAPVVAVSTPGYRAPGFYQSGSRQASVGRPLPGVTVKVVDPETREPLPIGESGLVIVRGPNIMQGYLRRDDLTREAMHEDFYITGDIGRIDEEGFLFLTDRMARFSKVGGEMVPHGLVEEHLQTCSGAEERAFVVCGVPDPRKGERLMVLTTLGDEALSGALAQLERLDLPALFIPRPDQFIQVDALPVLGTGKIDLRAARERCLEGRT